MAIIKHTTAAGITYCYDSTPKWDPEKKQARPHKKYLGRWDEETQSIVPSTGKRGRKKKADSPEPLPASDMDQALLECREKLFKAQEELKLANERINSLVRQNQAYATAIESIRKELQHLG